MSTKKFSLFSGIIILLYIVAVVFFIGGLFLTSSKGAKTSQEYFEHLTVSVEQLHESEQILSSSYIEALKKLTDETPYIQAILLKKDSVPFLAYPTDSGLIKQDENHTPVLTSSSPVIKMHTKTVSLGTTGTITITAAVSTLTKDEVFSLAIKSFIVILVTTIVIFVHLLLTKRNRTTQSQNSSPEEISVPPVSAEPIATETGTEESTPENVIEEPAEIAMEPVPEETVPLQEEEISDNESSEAAEPIEPVVPVVTDPTGLFSPVTGFCWESYLEQRLETELTRAASSEEDLAVFDIRLAGVKNTTNGLKPFFEQLLQFFQYRDLVFEYGTESYICIVPNISVDGAMNASEKLYTLLHDSLTSAGISAKIVIGISTRSMRLTSAARLLNEAKEAVAHGLEEDDMPIVAFRVNQEKYKEYLEEEAKKIQDVQSLLSDIEQPSV